VCVCVRDTGRADNAITSVTALPHSLQLVATECDDVCNGSK
jgi:hypothetical protein